MSALSPKAKEIFESIKKTDKEGLSEDQITEMYGINNRWGTKNFPSNSISSLFRRKLIHKNNNRFFFKQQTLYDRAHNDLKQADPNLDEDESQFKSAIILLIGIETGNRNNEFFHKETGYDKKFIKLVLDRLFKNGIWKPDDKITYVDYDLDEDNELVVATWFWIAVCCAEGTIARCRNDS